MGSSLLHYREDVPVPKDPLTLQREDFRIECSTSLWYNEILKSTWHDGCKGYIEHGDHQPAGLQVESWEKDQVVNKTFSIFP